MWISLILTPMAHHVSVCMYRVCMHFLLCTCVSKCAVQFVCAVQSVFLLTQAVSRQDIESEDTNRSLSLRKPKADLCGPRDPSPCCPHVSRQWKSFCSPQLSLPPNKELLGSICCVWHMVALTHLGMTMHSYKHKALSSITTHTHTFSLAITTWK